MPGLNLDVAHFDDRLDAAEDEVGLGALVDAGWLLLRPDPGIFERGLVVGTDELAEDLFALLLEHQLGFQHRLEQRLQIFGVLFDQAGARREHAIGVARAVDIDAPCRCSKGPRRKADEIESSRLEGFDRLGRVAHVADRDLVESHAVLLEPVIGQHDEARVGEDADIDHPGAEERHHFGKSRGVYEFEGQPVFLS